MVYLVGVYRQVGWAPDLTLLIQILALTAVQALVMVSGAVVISSQTTSTRAANLLASFIIIPMVLLIQAESIIMFLGKLRCIMVGDHWPDHHSRTFDSHGSLHTSIAKNYWDEILTPLIFAGLGRSSQALL